MKTKVLLTAGASLLCALLLHLPTRAAIVVINVGPAGGITFVPSNTNVIVGDIVRWTWVSGSHTSTSLAIPAGAAAWNNTMTSAAANFDYTVTVTGTYMYQCNFHSAGGMKGSFNAMLPMPVSLTNFNIKNTAGISTELDWTTTCENNCNYYILEKSYNAVDFFEMTKIYSKSSDPKDKNDYHYIDNDINNLSKVTYYRLKQFDKNNNVIVLSTRSYYTNFNTEITVFPNPVKTGLINVKSGGGSINEITIYDLNGNVVYHDNYRSNTDHALLDVSSISNGNYLLLINTGNAAVLSNLIIGK